MYVLLSVGILFALNEALPIVNNLPTELTKLNTTSRYKIISYDTKSWFGALNSCHAAGLEMASIHSQEDQDNVHNLITSTGIKSDWWTSGHDFETEHSFVWSSNGRPFTYTNWEKSFPKKGTYNCVMISSNPNSGDWINNNCMLDYYYFLCQE